MKKSIIALPILGLSTMALVSCGTKVNSKTPYGTLSDTNTYATLGNNSISEKGLYNLMRNKGYDEVYSNLKNQLFSDVLTNEKYFAYDQEKDAYDYYLLNSNVVNAIYGVSTVSSYKALSEKDRTKQAKQYADTLFNAGTTKEDGTYYSAQDILDITITFAMDENGDEQFVANFPYAFYESYVFDRAMNNYVLEQLKNPDFKYYYKNEYIKGEGKNDYYVSDDDIRDYYYSTGKTYGENRGIVIKFASEAQANRVMQKAIGSTTIDPENYLEQYLAIYNLKNTTDENLTVDNYLEDEQTNLAITKKKNRFTAKFSGNLQTFFQNMEDGDYLTEAFNIGGAYYLVYRISGSEEVEWENLNDSDKVAGDGSTVYDKMLDDILSNKSLSSLVTKIVDQRFEDIVDNGDIEIYDPLVGYNFKQSYSDFKYTKTFNNDYIYKVKYNGEEYTYTPKELYSDLEAENGTSTAVEYLKNQWALGLTYIDALVDSDTYSDYKSSLNSEIKSFNKGNKSIPKKLGLETYLQTTYGVSTKDDVLNEEKATLILEKVNTYFGNPTTDKVNFDETSTLYTQFASIYKDLYDNYFSAEISHILISVDEDYSGTTTDPDVYKAALKEIDPTLAEEFDKTILNISNAIISEVKILTISKTVTEALTYIVEAFNNNYKIASLSYNAGHDIYWNDYKNEFPITLKTEDLSTIDLFKASSYVEEFSNRVKELYDKVIDGTFDEKTMDDKGVFEFSETLGSIDSLCKTTYGYHLLNIYGTEDKSSAVFKKSSDSKAKDSDEYMQYEHLEVVLIPDDADGETDKDDDPEYVLYANGYSDNDYASASQLFVYFYETTIIGSHSLLKTSVNSAISTMFDGAVSNYTSTNFQNWKYLTYELKDLTFTSSADKKNLYTETLKNTLVGYEPTKWTLYTDWVDTTKYNWSIDYNFIWK